MSRAPSAGRSSPRRPSASAATATRTQVGRHRGRRRRRPDRAVSLLRVQAALPVRDHGRGDRGLPRRASARSRTPTRTRSRRWARSCGDCFDLTEHDVLRNRVLVAEQGLLVRPAARSEREERGTPGRARPDRATLSSPGPTFLAARDAAGRDPRERPASADARGPGLYNSIWHWYRPNGIVALRPRRRLLHEPRAGHDGRRSRRTSCGRGRRHDVLRAVLRAPRRAGPAQRRWSWSPTTSSSPSSGRPAPIARAAQFLGGIAGAARVHRRRRHRRLGPLRAVRAASTATSSSRSARRAGTSGERIGTFLAVAQLDRDGRMRRYMVARSPAHRLPQLRMRAAHDFVPVADGLLGGTPSGAAR